MSQDLLTLEMLKELRAQRDAFERSQALAATERRSEQRWKRLFQALFFGTPLIIGIVYFLFFLSTAGFKWGPMGSVVGVVRIDGQIASSEHASADRIVPVLHKAFADPNVKAVVLSIDSPGGAPVEAERIYTAIDELKRKHRKPVVAVINNVGASAAYMIALHADKIVAGKYSLVGSIGAIMAPWRLDRALAKFDVTQRVFASGKLKSFLNPFTPVSPEVEAKAQALVDQMGQTFASDVATLRASHLKQGVDIATGEVWGGQDAKTIGLIDEIGTIDDVVAGTGFHAYDFGPGNEGMGLFSAQLQGAVNGAVRSALEVQLR